jgi:transposase-like protein
MGSDLQVLSKVLQQIIEAENAKATSECPKCYSKHVVKNGHNKKGDQRFRCMDCNRFITTGRRGYPLIFRQIALQLYLEGNGFRAIERLMGVSNATLIQWIRELGKRTEDPANDTFDWAQIVEMDEICTFVGSKKNLRSRVQSRVGPGSGWLLTGMDTGLSDSVSEAGRRSLPMSSIGR